SIVMIPPVREAVKPLPRIPGFSGTPGAVQTVRTAAPSPPTRPRTEPPRPPRVRGPRPPGGSAETRRNALARLLPGRYSPRPLRTALLRETAERRDRRRLGFDSFQSSFWEQGSAMRKWFWYGVATTVVAAFGVYVAAAYLRGHPDSLAARYAAV